jgi:hypothetical protein
MLKKTTLLAVLLLTALLSAAKPVGIGRASDVAAAFFPDVDLNVAEMGDIYLFTPVDGPGFVLVAADDCVRPVLAYSRDGAFDPKAMPDHVYEWISAYNREIASLREAGATPSAAVQALWEQLPDVNETVAPLMTTQWNQSPYYNNRCPVSPTNSRHAVTGCVATAMAQVMKYWNHPAVGHGSNAYSCQPFGLIQCSFDTAYSWSDMPDRLNRFSSDAQVFAVAQLMFHVGVSVSMNYGTGSSGAHVISYGSASYPSAENALKQYFRYNPMLHGVSKRQYTDAEWDALLKDEIDHHRPVLYSGFDGTGGHAFVIDGYSSDINPRNGNRFFHVNWGWGGSYDGYYTLDSLSPGAGGVGGNATYTFNSDNSALVGVQPSTNSEGDGISVVSVRAADPAQGSVTGSGRYHTFSDTVMIIATAAEGYRFDRWTSGNVYNPVEFIANGDYRDTALFVPFHGDTLGYSADHMLSSWYDDYSSITEWGIRIPPSLHDPMRSLTAIQFYLFAGGDYTFNVYRGASIDSGHLVYTYSDFYMSTQSWYTVELDSALYVGNHEPLFITVRYSGGGYPAAMTAYSGNPDGCWYHLPSGWDTYDRHGNYCSWMLRGLFAPRAGRSFTLATAVAGADSNYAVLPSTCYALGDGTYHEDSLVTVTAHSDPGDPVFYYWVSSRGDTVRANPYSFHLAADLTLTAVFGRDRTGIDPVDALSVPLTVRLTGRTLHVDAPAGTPVALYDIQGRLIHHSSFITHHSSFTLPAPGVYLLRAAGQTRKIIVL